MKRRRAGLLVAGLIAVIFVVVLWGSSVLQNARVRTHFDALLTAVQQRDWRAVQGYYDSAYHLSDQVREVLFAHRLLGWDYQAISNQPWPLQMQSEAYSTVQMNIYYEMPETLLQPDGPYEAVNHPSFGPCGVVHATLRYRYQPDGVGWFVLAPRLGVPDDWVCPYQPAKGPAAGVKFE